MMVEKAKVKVQRWVFAAAKPQTLNHITVQCELLLHSSQCTQGPAYVLADYSAVHRLLQH